jgi:hypothetical protein
MFKPKGIVMLSVIADALLSAIRTDRWDAPGHFKHPRGPRSNVEIEREISQRRHRLMRDAGMW